MGKLGRPPGEPKAVTSVCVDMPTLEKMRKSEIPVRVLIIRGLEWQSLKDQIEILNLQILKMDHLRESMQHTIIDQAEIIENNERAKKADPMDPSGG
jgi:hypothetical protein